jgi:NitT/TauT family transport system substrate-binding protein
MKAHTPLFAFASYLSSVTLLSRRLAHKTRLSRMRSLGSGAVLAGLLLSGATLSAQDKKPNQIVISYPSISGAQAVLWIAKETGIFRDNGLDVDLVYIGGGPRSMAALLSGQLQVIGTGGNALVAANLNGAKDTVLIATTYNTLVFSLMTRANLKDPKELKGKTFGVTGIGSLSDFTLRTLLRRWSLDPTRDVVVRAMGGYPEILSGMQAGLLDGGIFSPPGNLNALAVGFREFIDAGSTGIEYASTCYGTTRRFIRERRETVGQFIKSLTAAIHRFKSDKPGSLKIMQRYIKNADPKVLEETYRVYALQYLPRAPYPTHNGVKAILDSLETVIPEAKKAEPGAFVDVSLVQELDKSGWIDRMYR